MSFAVLAAFVLALGAFAVLPRVAVLGRRRGMAGFALQAGLDYAVWDVLGVGSLPFALLGRGDRQRVENVVYGRWNDVDVVAFDYSYRDDERGTGRSRGAEHRFDCAIVPVDAFCAALSIHPENVLTRLANDAGFRDIEFESEDFNRAFRVRARDGKFANDVVDARMMQWLLDHGRGFSFEAASTWLLVSSGRLRPFDMLRLIGTATGFRAHVPRVVYELYGARAEPLGLGRQPNP
jgi:hypothetical protein